ncbi:hypothetical protein NC651_033294 [Populus alba x Populus x berolinensis]|nr:hypothetical protein NC651_033294 [Populus alba x Populus x berolinensis]
MKSWARKPLPPNLAVLDALDNARIQLYHITAFIIAGMGFFTDAYDLFCISTVSELLGRLYYYDPITGNPGKLATNVNNVVTGVALVVYANKKTRRKFIAAVFAMQAVGIIFAGLVSMILSKIFLSRYHAVPFSKDPILSTQPQADFLWRINVLMLGALPAMLTFFWRMKMPETGRYTALIEGNAKKAAVDMGRVLDIDIAFYSQNLTQKDIFPAMGLTKQAADVSAYLYSFQSTRLRSTGHALSAAAGKAGAMTGAFLVQTYTLDGDVTEIKRALLALSFTN